MERLPYPSTEMIEGIRVVRDDLIPGGSKRRAIDPLLVGAEEFVYASPAAGYAQVALAHAAKAHGVRATIFTAARKQLHRRTLQAQELGAQIILVPHGYLSNVTSKARAYCQSWGAVLIPFGLDTPDAIAQLRDAARDILNTPDDPIEEVWAAAGSGTLIRALQLAWPDAEFHAVQVGKAPDIGRARLWKAPERFEQDAQEPPPFPSCGNYDAKVWRFVKAHARPGALMWNVAGD